MHRGAIKLCGLFWIEEGSCCYWQTLEARRFPHPCSPTPADNLLQGPSSHGSLRLKPAVCKEWRIGNQSAESNLTSLECLLDGWPALVVQALAPPKCPL